MKIDIRSAESVFITINGITYYIDDSTDEQIVEVHKEDSKIRNPFRLIKTAQPSQVTTELLDALIEATSLFDNYPETHEAIGTHEVINEAIKKIIPTWEYLPIKD
jgi:hypothetical protein